MELAIRSHPRAQTGFTLIEMMIALAVLAFGLLAIAALQVQALRDSTVSTHTSQATAIARAQMDQVQRRPWAALTAVADTGWQIPAWVPGGQIPVQLQAPVGAPVAPQIFNLAWRVTSTADPNLMNVDVEVSWTEPNRPNLKPTRTGLPTVTLSSARFNW